MDKNKLTIYASYVAITCGLLILTLSLFFPEVTTFKILMGLLFIAVGMIGLRWFRR
ncbi:hypothetical protein [Emticicia sp. BO119]|uniref:hypothetical protein n=1 Tax=Emticicia sp. BO119 TaxID=2757768 RepID=UPI0015F0A536|nr:hypothetical protein [Emticicia sp. BO119]MBA4853479.1 hypothetical protein [Emticicia sp. BO119]